MRLLRFLPASLAAWGLACVLCSAQTQPASIAVEPEALLASPQRFWARSIMFRDRLTGHASGRIQRIDDKRYIAFYTRVVGTVYATAELVPVLNDLELNRDYAFSGSVFQYRGRYYIIVSSVDKVLDAAEMVREMRELAPDLDPSVTAEALKPISEIIRDVEKAHTTYSQEKSVPLCDLYDPQSIHFPKTMEMVRSAILNKEMKDRTMSSEMLAQYLVLALARSCGVTDTVASSTAEQPEPGAKEEAPAEGALDQGDIGTEPVGFSGVPDQVPAVEGSVEEPKPSFLQRWRSRREGPREEVVEPDTAVAQEEVPVVEEPEPLPEPEAEVGREPEPQLEPEPAPEPATAAEPALEPEAQPAADLPPAERIEPTPSQDDVEQAALAEAERLRAEQNRLAEERAELERLKREAEEARAAEEARLRAEQERLAAERAEVERLKKEAQQQSILEQRERERIAAVRAKQEKDALESEAAREQQAEQERKAIAEAARRKAAEEKKAAQRAKEEEERRRAADKPDTSDSAVPDAADAVVPAVKTQPTPETEGEALSWWQRLWGGSRETSEERAERRRLAREENERRQRAWEEFFRQEEERVRAERQARRDEKERLAQERAREKEEKSRRAAEEKAKAEKEKQKEEEALRKAREEKARAEEEKRAAAERAKETAVEPPSPEPATGERVVIDLSVEEPSPATTMDPKELQRLQREEDKKYREFQEQMERATERMERQRKAMERDLERQMRRHSP